MAKFVKITIHLKDGTIRYSYPSTPFSITKTKEGFFGVTTVGRSESYWDVTDVFIDEIPEQGDKRARH